MKQKNKEKFTDRLNRQLRTKQQGRAYKKIEFACRNCLKMFIFEYTAICFDKHEDIRFTPEPACPRCGATEEIVFSDFGQEHIENMIFKNEIRRCKQIIPNKTDLKLMRNSEIKLNKQQFKLFNQDDQFAIFDEEGGSNFEDFNQEVDKLFKKYDTIIVTENNYIYGEKNGNREELSGQAYEGYSIALEITQDL